MFNNEYSEEVREIDELLNYLACCIGESITDDKTISDMAWKIYKDFKELGYALDAYYCKKSWEKVKVDKELVAKNISNLQQKMVEKRKKNKNDR